MSEAQFYASTTWTWYSVGHLIKEAQKNQVPIKFLEHCNLQPDCEECKKRKGCVHCSTTVQKLEPSWERMRDQSEVRFFNLHKNQEFEIMQSLFFNKRSGKFLLYYHSYEQVHAFGWSSEYWFCKCIIGEMAFASKFDGLSIQCLINCLNMTH